MNANKKIIAYFFGALNRGGAETLVYDVCKKKDYAPFEIVCLYRKDGEYTAAYRETGVKMIKVNQKGQNFIRFLRSFRKTVLDNHIDIIHAQTGFNALICIFSLLGTPVKLITTFHGFSFASAPWWQRKLVYKKNEQLLCVSEYEKNYYERKWNLPPVNKLRVVYNGIDFSKLDNPVSDNNAPINLDRNGLNMIMVGSFRSGRSQAFICQVADRLNQRGFPFSLYFAGRRDDKEFQRYDDCVHYCASHNLSEKVHFLGARNDIANLLRQMDLFVYASEHDTFGIAVLEAIASSIPVIVNDWTVMKEITHDGQYARLYETDNIEDCISKIMEIHRAYSEMPETLQKETDTAASAIREQFSIEHHIDTLNDVYLSV